MHTPLRTCIGCRQVRPVAQLLRCRVAADQRPVCGRAADRVAGRSAWLCTDSETCLRTAVSRRAFERAWRRSVSSELIDALENEVAIAVHGHRGGHMEQLHAADEVGCAARTKG